MREMLAYWHDLKMAEIAGLTPEKTVVVQPIAAVEQHGPHLPTGTDMMIGEGLMAATLNGWQEAGFNVLVLPTVPYGKSDEHMSFPGTITLTTGAYIRSLRNIGQSVADSGFQRLVFMSSHGGNSPAMALAAQELRRDHGMFVVCANWMRLGFAKGLASDHELAHGIHGGLVETAIMLALRPELVDMDLAEDFKSQSEELASRFKHLGGVGKLSFAWMTEDLSSAGTMGDAKAATQELGQALIASAANEMRVFLAEVAAFELANLR